ncbi:MAG: hypothetical protein L6V93_22070 [Clostridiales bacterium]|nr:MAG: hypothetical protein L6V93_22070 [Clostridiales bacterium]
MGFASAKSFDKDDAVFKIFPETKKRSSGLRSECSAVFTEALRREAHIISTRQWALKNLEETVMPLALLNVSNFIEDEGFTAVPQRRNQLIMNDTENTNPEMDYSDVMRGVKAENQIDFLNCAVLCGLGEKSMINSLLTKEYGPFVRYCFILTDAVIEPTEHKEEKNFATGAVSA